MAAIIKWKYIVVQACPKVTSKLHGEVGQTNTDGFYYRYYAFCSKCVPKASWSFINDRRTGKEMNEAWFTNGSLMHVPPQKLRTTALQPLSETTLKDISEGKSS